MKKTITTCLAVFVSLCTLHADPAPAQAPLGDYLKNCFIVITRQDDGRTINLPLDRKLSVHLQSDTVWFNGEKAAEHWINHGGFLKKWEPNLVRADDEAAAYTADRILKLSDDNIFCSEPAWEVGKKAPAIQEGVSHDEFVFEPQQVGDTTLTYRLYKNVLKKNKSEKLNDKISFKIHVVEGAAAPVAPTITEPVVPTTTEPVAPTTTEPVLPTTTEAAAPTTAEPVVPATTQPAPSTKSKKGKVIASSIN